MNSSGKKGGLVFGFLMVAALCLTVAPATARGADVSAGKAKFQQLCVSCHGSAGKGNGPIAANLPVKPPDYTDSKVMSSLKDEEMFKAIKMGGLAVKKSPVMPPWGKSLSDQDIRNIIAYIRTLAKQVKK